MSALRHLRTFRAPAVFTESGRQFRLSGDLRFVSDWTP
jgi:hypothetical protein